MAALPNRCSSLAGRSSNRHVRRIVLPVCSIAMLALFSTGYAMAEDDRTVAPAAAPAECLPDGSGYLKARLAGAIDAELDWGNDGTECSGSSRPNGEGLRVVFKRSGESGGGDTIVLLFGISGVEEGDSARDLPVNVTIIREGTGEFYGTQGDERCYVDSLRQEPIAGIPLRERAYRVVARGYCMQPARAVQGEGSVLLSRFDYAGRVDFAERDEPAPAIVTDQGSAG